MSNAITNTSPLVYLHRIGTLEWLPKLFESVWLPDAVVVELDEGRKKGYDVPIPINYPWLKIVNPQNVPSEWFALDLGVGEIAAMALAQENPQRIVLLDDALARKIAQASGLQVWGTLRIVLEAKAAGLVEYVEPVIENLQRSGMWISEDVQQRILALAGEI